MEGKGSPVALKWREARKPPVQELGVCPLPLPESEGTLVPAAAAKSLQSCPTLCDPIDGPREHYILRQGFSTSAPLPFWTG